MEKRDYYEVLGLTEDEKKLHGDEFENVLKKKFRKLSFQYHPDRQTDKSEAEKKDAEEKFKEIAEAYGILSDPQKRSEYDQFGFNGRHGQGFQANVDINDIINNFFRNAGGGGDFFMGGDDFFGGRRRRDVVNQGNSIRIRIPITIEDAYNGVTKKIRYSHKVRCHDCGGSGLGKGGSVQPCRHCGGSGMIGQTIRRGNFIQTTSSPCPHCNGTGEEVKNPCRTCKGTGLVSEKTEKEIFIPKGVMNGMSYVYQGEGDAPERNNGINGDLIIVVVEQPSDKFNRDGNTVITRKEVSIIDALLGNEVEVNCVDGTQCSFKLNMGAKTGENYRLRGKGMPIIDSSQYGDMLVVIDVISPNMLNEDEKEAIRKLGQMEHFKRSKKL